MSEIEAEEDPEHQYVRRLKGGTGGTESVAGGATLAQAGVIPPDDWADWVSWIGVAIPSMVRTHCPHLSQNSPVLRGYVPPGSGSFRNSP